jgi:transcriptional regulator with XRE-family HTH domain
VEDVINVGLRLRELRIGRDLSIRALAESSGLNVNTISLIENGKTSPSVSTLQQLAIALQVPIRDFFDRERETDTISFQKANQRRRIAFDQGILEDLGAGFASREAEPCIVHLGPGAGSGPAPIVHTGLEFVYCLEGRLSYRIEDESFTLEPGDSLLFEAHLPHRWQNEGPGPSRSLLVLCPREERDRPIDRHFSLQAREKKESC